MLSYIPNACEPTIVCEISRNIVSSNMGNMLLSFRNCFMYKKLCKTLKENKTKYTEKE